MVKHVVMWRYKEGVSQEQKESMKQQLEALLGVVPTLKAIEVGLNVVEGDAAQDVVLVSAFDSMEGLKQYAEHPEHLKVVEFVKPLVCARSVVDYII